MQAASFAAGGTESAFTVGPTSACASFCGHSLKLQSTSMFDIRMQTPVMHILTWKTIAVCTALQWHTCNMFTFNQGFPAEFNLSAALAIGDSDCDMHGEMSESSRNDFQRGAAVGWAA